jgi:quercetin dioxygenase-like cupin family protein
MVEANTGPTSQSKSALPPDNPRRELSIINPDSLEARHISIVGDTYTILISGQDTDGRYCMIDMLVPTGGGPGPHRHDFEEMFSILEGEIELTFRGEKSLAKAGATVNIPANAPHFFKNVAAKPARLLCVCSPAGARTNSSWQSAKPSRAVPLLRLASARKNRRRSWRRQRRWRQDIERNC